MPITPIEVLRDRSHPEHAAMLDIADKQTQAYLNLFRDNALLLQHLAWLCYLQGFITAVQVAAEEEAREMREKEDAG